MLSLEPRKLIITLHNNSSLTSYSISSRHITWLQKCCKCWQTKCCTCYYWPNMIGTIVSIWYATNNKRHCWDPIPAAVSVLNTYVVYGLNGLDSYTLYTVHEQDSVVEGFERRNYMRAIAHVAWYVCTLLVCNSWVSCIISWATLLAHTCKCQVSVELYCNCCSYKSLRSSTSSLIQNVSMVMKKPAA